MAHFAQLDENNIVVKVIVVSNESLLDDNGIESEQKGIDFCTSLLGGIWIQTSYNASIRKNFAGVGFKYDSEKDAFIPFKPFESWLFNDNECTWYPPVKLPDTGGPYYWDEETTSWVEYQITL
jgi:hypothetical protein